VNGALVINTHTHTHTHTPAFMSFYDRQQVLHEISKHRLLNTHFL